jgi:hypothetical protein
VSSGSGVVMGHHRQSVLIILQTLQNNSYALRRPSQERRSILAADGTARHAFGERTHPGQAWDWAGYEKRARFTNPETLSGLRTMPTVRELGEQIDVGKSQTADALLILRYAPAEAKKVMKGTLPFNRAYLLARERKEAARSHTRPSARPLPSARHIPLAYVRSDVTNLCSPRLMPRISQAHHNRPGRENKNGRDDKVAVL